MKRMHTIAMAGLLAAGASTATATSLSLNEFTPGIMPVLVQVNARGHVTDVSPSQNLTPKLSRLLRQNIDELISKPATDHGHAVNSQFVINLALQASPLEDGNYSAQFAYVSSSPVPNGSWYWVKVDGHRLALANRNGFNRPQRTYFNDPRNGYRPANVANFPRPSAPPVQNAARNTPSPAPRGGR